MPSRSPSRIISISNWSVTGCAWPPPIRYRAQGGGVLRGVPLAVNETPAGIGGPGSPLLTSAATGVLSQTNLPVNVTDTQLIAEGQDNLAYLRHFSFRQRSADPALRSAPDRPAQRHAFQHAADQPREQQHLPRSPTTVSAGNAAYQQGFSTGTQIAAGFQSQYNSLNSAAQSLQPVRHLHARHYGDAAAAARIWHRAEPPLHPHREKQRKNLRLRISAADHQYRFRRDPPLLRSRRSGRRPEGETGDAQHGAAPVPKTT